MNLGFMELITDMELSENGMMNTNSAKNFQKIHNFKDSKEKEQFKRSMLILSNVLVL